MKKQKMFNRVSSLILAVIMVLGLCVSPVATQQASAKEEGDMSDLVKIVPTKDNLTFEEGSVEDVCPYFTVEFENLAILGGTDTWGYFSDTDSRFEPYYKTMAFTYYKVESDGSETALSSAPTGAGNYKVYASLTEEYYYLYDANSGELGWVYTPDVASGSLQYTITGDGTENIQLDIDLANLKLLYGDEKLADEDAYVLLILGDGFTESEQSKFYEEAEKTAKGFIETAPFNEMADVIKIYAFGTISKDSGAKGDKSATYAEAEADKCDTFYSTRFWYGGMPRLLFYDGDGLLVAKAVKNKVMPYTDCSLMLVNSTTYGGGGGENGFATCSLTNSYLDVAMHELGHSIANLADEYWAGAIYASEDKPNITTESDPTKVKWSKFVGKNNIGVYKHIQYETSTNWYRPSKTCRMEAVNYDFCEVCQEALRKSMCKDINVSTLFFQTYAEEFYVGNTGIDMSKYFILRQGDKEVTGDQLGDKLTLVYKDAEGNAVEGIPNKEGTYTVEATFAGNDNFSACKATGTYTLELDLIKLSVSDKEYDGKAAQVSCSVDEGYTVKLYYTGTQAAAEGIEYSSEKAPTKPGEYTVEATAYDSTGKAVSKKSKSYKITARVKELINNDSSLYPGAAVWYNNKRVIFVGEGFTEAEQSKFEKAAKEYAQYILSQEPFKQVQTNFDFTSINTISDASGVGKTAKKTYFGVTYDKNGKPSTAGSSAALSLAKAEDPYSTVTIVIVNDSKNVKTGNAVTVGSKRVIYGGLNTASKSYAAREVLNLYTGHKVGYKASTTSAKAKQAAELIKALYYYYWGTSYAVIAGNAYSKEFIAGKKIDMSGCFKTYIDGKAVSSSQLKYKYTYYKNGKKLSKAPTTAGTYTVVAELITSTYAYDENNNYFEVKSDWKILDDIDPDYGYYQYVEDADGNFCGWIYGECVGITVGKEFHLVPRTRGSSTFTILPASQGAKKFQAKKTTLSSVKSSSKKALTASWTTVRNADGYQVQYSTSSSFKGAKTVTVTGASSKTKTIKSLTSKKKYYVRVRAYSKIGGKKVYSNWSTKKTVTVK